MRKLITFFSLIILALGFTSCEDEIKAVLKTDVAPNELQTPSSDSYVLVMDDKNNTMETFEWTATDFGYKAAVAYTIQIDLVGNNFAGAVDVATTNSLESAISVGDFNDRLLALGISPEEAANIEIRIVSNVGSGVPLIYSSVQTVEVTSYATSFPPIWGMGAALKGWGPWPDNAVEWQSSAFKKYETVTYFTQGATFRWFAQLDWGPTSYNYPFFTTVSPIFENADDGDKNLKVVGATGWYKVNIDLSAKTVAAEAVAEPVLYMMGAALNGWGPWPGAAVKMTYIKPGVFEATPTFTVTGETFRFFSQADWGPSYNYPYFTGGVDAMFENAGDGDLNFRYLDTPGSHKILVDLNAKTVIKVVEPVLFVTGDDFGWGWNVGQYAKMTYKGNNVFETTATLTTDKLFRFFPQTGWSPSYNYSYFTTVDAELANQGVGTDENFKYIGTTGSRKITVNMTAKTVAVD